MTRFLVWRLAQMVPLLIGVTFITFAAINLVPGSPAVRTELNRRMRPEDVVRVEHHLGLDRPWPLRYVEWSGRVLRGDLGRSMANGTPVRGRVLGVLPNTLLLTTTSLLFALSVAVPLGVAAANRRDGLMDRLVGLGSVGILAMPVFWLGLLVIVLFSVKFRQWGMPSLPAGGMRETRGNSGFWDRAEHLLLPAFTLGLVQIGGWALVIRSAMLDALRQDYVRTAQAKGLTDRAVLYRHALRNAVPTLVTLIGLGVPGLFGGAVFVEGIFAWNGVGTLAIQAFAAKDVTVVLGIVLMLSALTMLSNLAADVIAATFHPMLRDGTGHRRG